MVVYVQFILSPIHYDANMLIDTSKLCTPASPNTVASLNLAGVNGANLTM